MGAFLVALLMCAVVVLYAVAGVNSIPAKDWLLTGIPAWLQGLGTVGAAYVAWVAYSTWRDQDTWRRKAEFADQILRSAHRLTSSIDAMRGRVSGNFYGSTGPKEKDVEILANDPRRAEEMRHIVDASADLRSHVALARRDFGPNVESSMLAVASLAYHVTQAHRGLQDMDRMAVDLSKPKNKLAARKQCSVMGVHFYDLAMDDPVLRDVDEFGDMQMLFIQSLEEKLLSYR